ncbi:sigma-54-dependent Fis family transcriptional regulator [Labrys wisconsinensis]|uniref:Transcriptional regulator of acetoin/glycerol metabolism n=1 Tax=Labrys wisconsinensis TaxID=425677 RepID=A0ABU0J037_9HYPH|nr:sigma-54-dependent Fis family transcriptional regulator [Labrys wisconsinensis]MDQ0467632.1 transcriptional regulator of acetoin/glycerol metabolism [Labrys wisconsinensis]
MTSPSTTAPVEIARRQFFGEGRLPRAMVGAPIARSWQRCAALGLDIAAFPAIEPMTADEFRHVSACHERLRHVSRPELQTLRQEAQAMGSVVILTDPDGIILDTLGDAEFAGRAAQVALRPGVRWSEGGTGTNAIGTALYERRPIEVHGGEHYFETHAILTCAAAPIFDPQGRIAGALDLSGSALADHRYALGLVRMAVEQIEHRFFDEGFRDAEVVRFHTDPDLLGTAREGIFVFRDGRLIAANRHGLGLMQLDWSALNARRLDELFARPLAAEGIVRSRGRRGEPLFARLSRPPALPSPGPGARRGAAAEPWFDPAGEAMLDRARRLIDAEVPLLVTGETGTGKEIFARRLHQLSARAGGPFVPVNCAALPENLIESELFGYAEGAFTGARRQGARGLVREADKGILFLDEIGDMPLAMQARLLRVLQDRQVKPLGGGPAVTVDFALVCATHRDLAALTAAGAFRSDLYYRLAQYPFEMPALRTLADRRAVIVHLLAQHLPGAWLEPEAEAALAAYDWPGNFRQLAGTLRALAALHRPGEPVTADMLPQPIRAHAAAASAAAAPSRLEDIERDAMQRALDLNAGNVSRAARALGVNRSTLYRRLRLS